jgi:hypothetical protein
LALAIAAYKLGKERQIESKHWTLWDCNDHESCHPKEDIDVLIFDPWNDEVYVGQYDYWEWWRQNMRSLYWRYLPKLPKIREKSGS